MSAEVRFDELKRRTYLAYHNDGISDAIVGIGALGFGLSMLLPESMLWMTLWLIVLAAASFAAIAVLVGVRRYYAYALLAAGLAIGVNEGLWPLSYAMMAFGGILLATGVCLLVRFMRAYPVAGEEPSNAS